MNAYIVYKKLDWRNMKRIINAFSVPILEFQLQHDADRTTSWVRDITSLFAKMDDKRLLSHEWNNNIVTDNHSKIGYSSFNHSNLANDSKFQSFFETITPLITEFLKQLEYNGDWKFENAWANVYPVGAYVPLHNHGTMHGSGVYYITATDGCGDLKLIDPKEYSLNNEPVETMWRGNHNMRIEATTDKLIMFPGYLKHETDPNYSVGDRIVISFNITCM